MHRLWQEGLVTDSIVRKTMARDKINSMYDKERKKEIDEQRKGHALISHLPLPSQGLFLLTCAMLASQWCAEALRVDVTRPS